MDSSPAAIRISGLKKTFRTGLRRKRTEALRGLDLEVTPGEIFGFLGPNGAGKTTTIKILVGLLRPDSGQAFVFDRPVAEVNSRLRVAYLPELPDFYDYLRPGEFLYHCGRLSNIAAGELKQKIPKLLQRVGLDPAEKRHLRKFSKGMLQRVGIAQTLLGDPDLYILDEPMGGLDPLGRRWVKDLILQLSRAGKTVFFSSHVLGDAEAICDRVAFLHQGRLLAQGPMLDVLQQGIPGVDASNTWEIVVGGEIAPDDPKLSALVSKTEPSGPNTLLITKDTGGPDALIRALLETGRSIRSVNRRTASLEEVFIRAMDAKNSERET